MTKDALQPRMTDEEYQEKYGSVWEYQKSSDEQAVEHALLSPEEFEADYQRRILEQEEAKKEQKTSIAKLKIYASMEGVQKHFKQLLGDRQGKIYVESVIIAVMNKPELQVCSPKSLMISAMRAASLRLSVDPAVKQAHLVPMGTEATLIIDYHGLVQMTVATQHYEDPPNVSEVHEGEIVNTDRFSGRVTITGTKTPDKTIKGQVIPAEVIGHCGYFKAKDGTERFLYMTNEECFKHAETYNPGGYKSKKSAWNKNPTDRIKMCRKTVLRQLVSRWGNFSPVQQQFFYADEPIIEAAAFDMPDDSGIVIPEELVISPEEHQKRTGKNMKELGF